MNQLKKALEQNGFREHKQSPMVSPHKHASSMWQIRIIDNSGVTLYFVNAFLYEKMAPNSKDQIEFEAILYPALNTKHWITLEFHGSDQESDIDTAMEFFRHTYSSLWCKPDPHNQ